MTAATMMKWRNSDHHQSQWWACQFLIPFVCLYKFFLLTNMGVLRPPICYIIASHLILFICLCLIYIRDELVNLPWQWKYCWYVLCTANMYDHYDFFYLFQSFFLFLHKIIHLRKINDFIPTKICACEKEGRFSRWAQQLTCGKSLSLRHNIVHIWGQPQLLVKLRFIEKKKSQFSHM